jgi:hypothetical protein
MGAPRRLFGIFPILKNIWKGIRGGNGSDFAGSIRKPFTDLKMSAILV